MRCAGRALLAGALSLVGLFGASGCIEDPDCGICDPHSLVLESISGSNYAGRKIHLLDPTCVGDNCPGSFDHGSYFLEPIGPCEESEDALASARGPAEYCRLAPTVTASGIEFVFNNLLDPTSVELVRRRPDNPQLFEVYDWKTRVLEIEGPITRFNGDYLPGRLEAPDLVTRAVNLSCIDNLADRAIPFSHLDYADPQTNPCNQLDPETGRPMKMQVEGTIRSTRGRWDSRAVAAAGDRSCDSPENGTDVCCNQCDFVLSTQVAKYGVRSETDPGSGEVLEGERLLALDNLRSPHDGSAIECDREGDVFAECREFRPGIDRSDETLRYSYHWSCDPATDSDCVQDEDQRVPYFDRLRSEHPDDRPPWLERRSAACESTAQCIDAAVHNLAGTQCVGVDPDGEACSLALGDETGECTEGRCRAPWFVQCRADTDTTGAQGYCVDTRFDDGGAAACLRSSAPFSVCDDQGENCATAPPGTQLAYCDGNDDAKLSAAECCQDSLGLVAEDGTCDPLLQSQLTRVDRYSRNALLPEPTRDCICSDLEDASPECREAVASGCVDDDGRMLPGREGEYAVKFVTRRGGIIYDPAIKGFEWRPADLGAVPRATVEDCAQGRSLIPPRSLEDGWRAHDAFDTTAEAYEDFDRAMCSGSTYTIQFAEAVSDTPVESVQDKLGNTLQGKSEYIFETPQFHVVPDSGFPTENLRIGACDDFEIRLSNKYDLSPENLNKLQIWALSDEDEFAEPTPGCGLIPLAGGDGCAETEAERDTCTPPCLTVDVSGMAGGSLRLRVDPAEFGRILETGRRYRIWIPGLLDPDEANDPALYSAAFWDACGMPLVLGTPDGAVEYTFDFTIDEPKCKEDADLDNVQLSCDNADDVFNPDQADVDGDGVGDVVDLCPTVPGTSGNSADSDKDGVGNACDNCRQPPQQYNENAPAGLSTALLVRNSPMQTDTDRDGIGDACDNCVRVPNCQSFGPDSPWSPGDPIAYNDANLCQRDDNRDLVGDACMGDQSETAAGPVGFGDDDDFDQDGVANAVDGCPRQPVDVVEVAVTCESTDDCAMNRDCHIVEGATTGVCGHLDSDGDGVGDVCDTCPSSPNPLQVLDGAAQADDADGDFVGVDCETIAQCADRTDPRPFAFYEVSSHGFCCTTLLVETEEGVANAVTDRLLTDPDGLPVLVDCDEADEVSGFCRPLPMFSMTAPGVLTLPPGCDEALAAAGYDDPRDNPKLTATDADGLDALWGNLCLLPQLDQDFDAVGDECDLCKFDFDPNNRPFTDVNGKLWPKDGAFCNGDYAIENKCGDDDPVWTGTGTGGEESTGEASTG